MRAHPGDVGEALDDTGINETGRSERGVREKADHRHEHELLHDLDADGVGRVDVDHGAGLIKPLVHRPEALFEERHATRVREQHHSWKVELAENSIRFYRGLLRSVHGQCRE